MQAYVPSRRGESRFVRIRGLDYHVRCWPAIGSPRRTVVLLHGWMDVSASFQFVADCLPAQWLLLAPDWRGFGLTDAGLVDCFWFPDYLGDLDALLRELSPDVPVDLVGHSMGGNVAGIYAGVRPRRVRALANLEGLGMAGTDPGEAPARYAQWLDELERPASLRAFADLDAVADRLQKTNPRLPRDRALFLAEHWSAPGADGQRHLLASPAHRRVNPVLYRAEEVAACWRAIEAPVLWVLAQHRSARVGFVDKPAYRARVAAIARRTEHTLADCGHMMHHDRPQAVADLIRDFFDTASDATA